MTYGIHTITCNTSKTDDTIHFFTKILGLKLVKKTVNPDAIDSYHLFFGNKIGLPSTLISTFCFTKNVLGEVGSGQVGEIYLQIPPKSISFWKDRFNFFKIKGTVVQKYFGERSLYFKHLEGIRFRLVENSTLIKNPNIITKIDKLNAIQCIYGAKILVEENDENLKDVLKILGYKFFIEVGGVKRYKCSKGKIATIIDVETSTITGINNNGTIHHLSFLVKDIKELEALRFELNRQKYLTTEIIDRKYFKSLYFYSDGKMLIEVSTFKPGLTIDETEDKLGKSLQVPADVNLTKEELENMLPRI